MQLESFSTVPLAKAVRTYLYQQYFDDEGLQGFITAANAETQGYLDWFNKTPLSVYTNESISGALLDWIGKGVYGISRPVVSSGGTRSVSGYATLPYLKGSYLDRIRISNESASLVNDDLYKRVLTWYTYVGDGRHSSVYWLRRRVARFIYGFGGSDIPIDYLFSISITQPSLAFSGAYATAPYATGSYVTRKKRKTPASHVLQITVPNTPISQSFKSLLEQGFLALPFQIRFSVVVSN